VRIKPVADVDKLFDRDDRADDWNVVANGAFDPVLQRHGAARAPVAGTVEADFDDIRHDIHKLNVAPVSLDGRADFVDHDLNLLAELTCFKCRHRVGVYAGRANLTNASVAICTESD